MSQEPEYLKRLRAQQERQGKAAKSASPDRPETGAPQYTRRSMKPSLGPRARREHRAPVGA